LCIDATKTNFLLSLHVVEEHDQFSFLLSLLEFCWGLGTYSIPTKMI
jgi:hypothetical protein